MAKTSEDPLKPLTQFEQISVEIVKQIVQREPPAPKTTKPPIPFRIVRNEA